jgi:hypothetical protein
MLGSNGSPARHAASRREGPGANFDDVRLGKETNLADDGISAMQNEGSNVHVPGSDRLGVSLPGTFSAIPRQTASGALRPSGIGSRSQPMGGAPGVPYRNTTLVLRQIRPRNGVLRPVSTGDRAAGAGNSP